MKKSEFFTVSALSRRQFLRAATASVVGVPFILPAGLRAASPNSKLNHACIGVTRMGHNDLKNFQRHERVQIVALCDDLIGAHGKMLPKYA